MNSRSRIAGNTGFPASLGPFPPLAADAALAQQVPQQSGASCNETSDGSSNVGDDGELRYQFALDPLPAISEPHAFGLFLRARVLPSCAGGSKTLGSDSVGTVLQGDQESGRTLDE